ncbi:MAG: hypothetical protein LOD92_04785 [Bacillales bacterium]
MLEKAKQKLLYTQIYCQEAFAEIEKEAKEIVQKARQKSEIAIIVIGRTAGEDQD